VGLGAISFMAAGFITRIVAGRIVRKQGTVIEVFESRRFGKHLDPKQTAE